MNHVTLNTSIMSQWTHVNGIVRIDAIRPLMPLFNPMDGTLPTPSGSEGELNVSVWENPEPSHMAAFTVQVFGDLRDYDDHKEVLEYFESITNGKMVRSGLLEITVEWDKTYIYRHHTDNDGNGRWELLKEIENG